MAANKEATIITLQQKDVNRSSADAVSAVNCCEDEAPAALEMATTECKDSIGGLLHVAQAGTLLDDDHQPVAPAGRDSCSSSSNNNNNMKMTITDLNGAAQPELLTWPNPVTAARLKWCGCLASTPCTHFTNMSQQYYYSAPTAPNSQWPSVAGSSATSLPHATGIRLNPIQQYLGFQQTDIRNLMKLKAQIVAHPMYDQLLAAHVACLRVATPIDHLPSIDAQLNTNIHFVASRYSSYLGDDHFQSQEEKEELDRFMAHYIILLHSFKEQLHEHVRVQAMDAVLSCWEIEKAFVNLTGISPIEGCGGTMSDDEEDKISNFFGTYPDIIDFHEGIDSLGLGPLLPTESERSLMERVRLELKSELKQGYKNRIADVREEILRKRRAGKLPTETTAILKKWWNAHSKWPYPTEDEKARLVQETGLELKQINNWFINQRKRNWHSHASTPSTSIPKDSCDVSVNNTTIGGQASNISLSLSCEADKISNKAQNTN